MVVKETHHGTERQPPLAVLQLLAQKASRHSSDCKSLWDRAAIWDRGRVWEIGADVCSVDGAPSADVHDGRADVAGFHEPQPIVKGQLQPGGLPLEVVHGARLQT